MGVEEGIEGNIIRLHNRWVCLHDQKSRFRQRNGPRKGRGHVTVLELGLELKGDEAWGDQSRPGDGAVGGEAEDGRGVEEAEVSCCCHWWLSVNEGQETGAQRIPKLRQGVTPTPL